MRALDPSAGPAVRLSLAQLCRNTRGALGLTQQQLADKVGMTRAHISAIERGRANPTIQVVERLTVAMGIELELSARTPIIVGDRRLRDPVHSRCSGYVDRRLITAGWVTNREVEIVQGRSHGWVDLLAFDPRTATLLVIEIKTRLDDLGAIERQLGWYTRSARDLARGFGWRATRVLAWLLVLASDECETRLRVDRELIDLSFPRRFLVMNDVVRNPSTIWPIGRGLALIDPSSRRRDWLTRSRIDGRRTAAPYRDYGHAADRLAH